MPLSPGITKALLLLSGMRCRYCGGEATTADHIIPQRLNGTDDAYNLIAACQPCNSSKGGARLPYNVEAQLRIEAWIIAPEVEHLAEQFRLAQKEAASRPRIVLARNPCNLWELI